MTLTSASTVQVSRASTRPRFLYFELATRGHHATYIRHLVHYWHDHDLQGEFILVVSPEFPQAHPEIADFIGNVPHANIHLVPLTAADEATLVQNPSTFKQRLRRAWGEWALVNHYAQKFSASHCFIASFDFFQFPFLFGKRLPCPVSGIHLKLTFHYSSFPGYQQTWKGRIQKWREQLLLASILRRPDLKKLLCLDPYAVAAIKTQAADAKLAYLPDPVAIRRPWFDSDALKTRLGIQPGRRLFLLFGELSARKGIHQTLEALQGLDTPLCERVCLLIVGHCHPAAQEQLSQQVEATRRLRPVQIIENYAFVSEQEVAQFFSLADVVLAPYQRHVGMSGILLQAAAAGKPVLSSDYGLMGQMVRDYQLGLAVDSTSPEALRHGFEHLLTSPSQQHCNLHDMKRLVAENTVEKFSASIFSVLGA